MSELEAMHKEVETIYSVSVDHVHVDIVHRFMDDQQAMIKELTGGLIKARDALILCSEGGTHGAIQYIAKENASALTSKAKAFIGE